MLPIRLRAPLPTDPAHTPLPAARAWPNLALRRSLYQHTQHHSSWTLSSPAHLAKAVRTCCCSSRGTTTHLRLPGVRQQVPVELWAHAQGHRHLVDHLPGDERHRGGLWAAAGAPAAPTAGAPAAAVPTAAVAAACGSNGRTDAPLRSVTLEPATAVGRSIWGAREQVRLGEGSASGCARRGGVGGWGCCREVRRRRC